MKSVTLRTLMREPLKVKRLTRTGKPVQITDNGRPLWIIRSATEDIEDGAERDRVIDEVLEEVLQGARSKVSLSKLVLESRR